MGTRTYSRRGVLTAAGRRRAGLEATNTIISSAESIAEWSPYTDTSLYNPALLPGDVQAMVKGGGDLVFNETKDPDEYSLGGEQRVEMDLLGLDHNKRGDCQIYADIMGIFRPQNGVFAGRLIDIQYNAGKEFISVYNDSFKTRDGLTPEGTGYAMVARQLAAMKELSKRQRATTQIYVNAVNGLGLTGASVWPKLGYDFRMQDIPDEVRTRLQGFGFDPYKYDSVGELLMDTNAAGQSGFDVWRPATEGITFSLSGETRLRPGAAPTLAEQITREYGKRKGFVKGQSSGEMFDDAVLRDIWLDMGRKA